METDFLSRLTHDTCCTRRRMATVWKLPGPTVGTRVSAVIQWSEV